MTASIESTILKDRYCDTIVWQNETESKQCGRPAVVWVYDGNGFKMFFCEAHCGVEIESAAGNQQWLEG